MSEPCSKPLASSAPHETLGPGSRTGMIAAVGGGLLIALKKRLTIRGDVRHYVIFDANHSQQIQEYSGALAVYF